MFHGLPPPWREKIEMLLLRREGRNLDFLHICCEHGKKDLCSYFEASEP